MFELRDGFHWVGVDFNITAEDLYNKKKNKGRPTEKRDSVKSEILRLLNGSEPILSVDLEARVCEITGCHINTVATAKKDWVLSAISPGGNGFAVCPVRTQ